LFLNIWNKNTAAITKKDVVTMIVQLHPGEWLLDSKLHFINDSSNSTCTSTETLGNSLYQRWPTLQTS